MLRDQGQDYWISISDMMSGLMVIFLFISVSFMLHVTKQRAQIKEIVVAYNQLQQDLYQDLEREFRHDLPRWNAIIDRQTLSVRFRAPEVLFVQGESVLRSEFKEILANFFPRYITILTSDKYKNDIEEIRIEGHTSSEWRDMTGLDQAYLNNMSLSQDRTRSVLEYLFTLFSIETQKPWIKRHVTANGLSSSQLIYQNETEDKIASRRVEFRVRTNAEKRIVSILQEVN